MKKINVSALCLLLLFSLDAFSQIQRVHFKKVSVKAVKIKKMIERHNYALAGLSGLAGLQQFIFWAYMLSPHFSSLFSQKNCVCGQTPPVTPEKMPFFKAIAEGAQQTFCTSAGWQSILVFCAGEATTRFVLEKLDTTFRHPDTLQWYVNVHVPYEKTIRGIKSVITTLSVDDLTGQSRVYYQDMIGALCDQLTVHAESMSAYMLYKSNELEGRQSVVAERAAHYIVNYHNDMIASIEAALEAIVVDFDGVKALLDRYQNELLSQRNLFSAIESTLRNY